MGLTLAFNKHLVGGVHRFLLLLFLLCPLAQAKDVLAGVRRIVFLGDSITYAGGYVAWLEGQLRRENAGKCPEMLDLGLPSETVSGLTEEGHASGRFPRPDLHERLGRVLAQTKPELVFACYGINDGIYQPFDEGRFRAFREGMERLHQAVTETGAGIVHLTSPIFDYQPIRQAGSAMYPEYDEQVLVRYTAWLLEQRSRGWEVIDLHTPMRAALERRRAQEPAFAFSKDGVHPTDEGHAVLAEALLRGLGHDPAAEPAALIALILKRQRLLSDAWLSACGHQRPGMKPGLPLSEAQSKAAALEPEIVQAALASPLAPPADRP